MNGPDRTETDGGMSGANAAGETPYADSAGFYIRELNSADLHFSKTKPRFGDRMSARALAFILCVLLGVGGLVAGYAALRSIDHTLRAPHESYFSDLYNLSDQGTKAITEDMFADKPYVESWYFRDMTDRQADELLGLYAIYGDGIEDELSEGALSYGYESTYVNEAGKEVGIVYDAPGGNVIESVIETIYYDLANRLGNSSYFSYGDPNGEAPIYEWTYGNGTGEPVVFDTRKLDDERFFYPEDDYSHSFRDFYDEGVKEAFAEVYAEEFAQIKDASIEGYRTTLLDEYDDAVKRLDDSGLLYYIGCAGAGGQTAANQIATGSAATADKKAANQTTTGPAVTADEKAANHAITNVEPDATGAPADITVFTSAPAFLSVLYDGRDAKASGTAGLTDNESLYLNAYTEGFPDGTALYLAWPKEVLDEGAVSLAAARVTARGALPLAAVAIVAALVLFILLLVWTGRRRADGTRRLYLWDRIFVEIQLFMMFLAFIIVFRPLAGGFIPELPSLHIPVIVFTIIAVAALGAFDLWCLLSLVRIIKARRVPRCLLTWLILKWIGRGIRGLARAV
ncbi:MAG: hypothetical protein LBS67_06130, partial [Clostridiales Family XIII bacterium]|nr:hypothetical protein [Clostridiales Family XIII bacterium]